MNFCKMCGTSLAARAAAAPVPSGNLGHASTVAADAGPLQAAAAAAMSSPAKAICASCGKGTPVGFAFCQHCGQRLSPQPGAAPAVAPTTQGRPSPAAPIQPMATPGSGPNNANNAPTNLGLASTAVPTAQPVTPTPPAGLPRSAPSAQPLASVPRVATPISTGNGASKEAYAQTMAPTPANLEALRDARASAERMAASLPSTTQPDMPAAPMLQPTHGTLVTVNRDGSDGRTIEIVGDSFDIGRTEGSLNFNDDPYLAARHVRLVIQGSRVILRALDQVNGAFVRVQSCDLAPGDSFLVGKELLRFEPLAPEERDPPSLVEHGVRIFGSAPREAWGRLRQLTIAGTTRDVWHLTRPELVLGREEGDVTFPDDEFMSRRHAAVKRVGTRARLEDLGSSNGTFVRVRGDRELKSGDVVRVGDQLLRYEP
jgi:hypothetical protein